MSFCEQAIVAATKAVTPPTIAMVVRPGTTARGSATCDRAGTRRRDHGRGVDQRGHRRGTLHRVGQPVEQRDLRAFAGRTEQQRKHHERRDGGVRMPALAKTLRYVRVPVREKSRNIAISIPTSPTRL